MSSWHTGHAQEDTNSHLQSRKEEEALCSAGAITDTSQGLLSAFRLHMGGEVGACFAPRWGEAVLVKLVKYPGNNTSSHQPDPMHYISSSSGLRRGRELQRGWKRHTMRNRVSRTQSACLKEDV